MKKTFLLAFALLALNFSATKLFAQAAAPATNVILSGIGDESDYYKFASLVRSANLDATLNALGSYTVFAPHNVIFRNMASGKLDSLTKDPTLLATVIKAHIVKGKYTKAAIIKILSAKNVVKLTNLLGQTLTFTRTKDNQLLLTDVKGNKAYFLKFDMPDPHAVIMGIDNVLMYGK